MDIGTERPALSSVLRDQTRALHVQAERSGFVADMLRGRASLPGYALYLRNLAPAYRQLELGLERHRTTPAIRDLAVGAVYRSAALAADLDSLQGGDWAADLPLLPCGRRYADRIADAAEGNGEALIGHAYVRYFGDLNGGQMLKRLLAKSLDLPAASLSFYDFPAIDDLADFKRSYREALDRSAEWVADREGVVEAALGAFATNIELSEAVGRAVLELQAGGVASL
ncbi:heme oxygenase (biliverdin-producing) [Phenylobacterium sp.]|uniref:biliverdin-producing heme oxygenase n=1 Tax=Phenylobacterium sp. TaxID=1871053 RepID=UPI0025DBA60E|nr:biliverdin-producing heme oxygenase [Phenylobacterium sp.]